MEHRIRRSAEELPTMLPEHDRRHAPGARCQADPLDSTSLCRSAAPNPHLCPSTRPLLSSTGSFQQRGRWQRLVAVLHDGAARARACGRPRFDVLYIPVCIYIYVNTIFGKKCRVWCVAADVATTTHSSLPLPTIMLPTPGGGYYKRVRLPSIYPKLISRENLLAPRLFC